MQQVLDFIVNHWALCLALAVLLGLIIRVELSSQVSGVLMISPQQTTNLVNRENAILVDIRTPDDYQKGHIAGAVNVEAGEVEAKIKKLQKYKQKPLIVLCNMGQSATKIGALLRKHGFEKVYALKGGVKAWTGANLPLVKNS